MTAFVRVLRTVLQAAISLSASVPLAVYVSPKLAAFVGAGLVVVVGVIHNILDAVGFFEKIAPSKAKPALDDAAAVLAQLDALAQALEGSLHQPVTPAEHPSVGLGQFVPATDASHQPMSAGYVGTPVPDVAGKDV